MNAARATFGLRQASRRWWVSLLVMVAATFWIYRARTGVAPGASRFGGPAQGTTYSVVLGGERPAAVVAALQASVDSLLANIDASMSTYDSTSEVSRLNRNRSRAPVMLSVHLAEVLRVASEVSRASGGAFDVTVAPLVAAWGFGAAARTEQVPSDALLDSLHARVGWEKLHLDGREVTKAYPQLEVDLDAIAPGYTVDLVSAMLEARGETNHFVEVGGEVRARGRNARGGPFRVGIEEPVPEQRLVRVVVGLSDRSLATSGNYRDFREIDGVRYTHILDPSTGRPVRHGLLSVSVLHELCVYADAWATALFAMGPERAWALAGEQGLDVMLLVAGKDGTVEERMTNGFAATVLRDVDGSAVDRTTRRSGAPARKEP